MAMLVRVGNSQGVRIPKDLVERLQLRGRRLVLEMCGDGVLIRPAATNGQGAAAVAGKRVRDPAWLKYMRNLPLDEKMGIPRAADRAMKPRCFGVYSVIPRSTLVAKDDRRGYPCMVVSPDDMNADPKISTVFIVPVAEGVAYSTRVSVRFDGKEQLVIFDHFHSVRKGNLISHLGDISRGDARRVADGFREVFVNPILDV